MKPSINIFILEDNRFYNQLLSKCVHTFMLNSPKYQKADYKLSSFFSADDLMLNLDKINKGIFLLDYYIEPDRNAKDVLIHLQNNHITHSVAILSRFENYQTFDDTFISGASAFIRKDKHTLDKIRIFLDETLTLHFS